MGTLLEQYTHAMDEFGNRLHKVADDQWLLPTPCAEWNLRALVAHVVDAQRWVPYLVMGGRVDAAGDRFVADPLGEDPNEAWDTARREALEAFSVPGALERHVWVSAGEMGARDYLWQLTVDITVHAWDLAHSIGADERLNPELVRRIAHETEKNLDEMAASGLYGRPVTVPPGADLQARTLALFGRR